MKKTVRAISPSFFAPSVTSCHLPRRWRQKRVVEDADPYKGIQKRIPCRKRRGMFITFPPDGGKIITSRGAVGPPRLITDNCFIPARQVASIFRAAAMLVFILSGFQLPSSDEKQEHSRVTAPE